MMGPSLHICAPDVHVPRRAPLPHCSYSNTGWRYQKYNPVSKASLEWAAPGAHNASASECLPDVPPFSVLVPGGSGLTTVTVALPLAGVSKWLTPATNFGLLLRGGPSGYITYVASKAVSSNYGGVGEGT